MTRPIITVDGIDGSGKSTFADRLCAALAAQGLEPCLARIDDFRQALDWRAGDESALYYDRYFDLHAVSTMAAAFAGGARTLSLPTFEGMAGTAGSSRTGTVGPGAVLLVEGIFIRRVTWPGQTTHIYLAVPFDLGRARVTARDTARGRDPVEVERRWSLRYRPAQERYLAECRPEELADVVFQNGPGGARPHRGDLSRLPPQIARALSSLAPS